jgi:hypothetical protein
LCAFSGTEKPHRNMKEAQLQKKKKNVYRNKLKIGNGSRVLFRRKEETQRHPM